MIAVTPSVTSTATLKTALAGQSGQASESPPGGSALAGFRVPEWGPDVAELIDRGSEGAVADRLLKGMMSAGHGLEALSFYLGLEENAVRDRVAALGLDQPSEKRLRRSGAANPWSLHDTRLFMALWLDNVSAASMAEAFGARGGASVISAAGSGFRCGTGSGSRTDRFRNAAGPTCRGSRTST